MRVFEKCVGVFLFVSIRVFECVSRERDISKRRLKAGRAGKNTPSTVLALIYFPTHLYFKAPFRQP